MTDQFIPKEAHLQPLVMVVEDEASIRELIARWLNDDGYPCVTAENGEQALEQFKIRAPTLVLTDIRMPKMDGLALLKRLSQDYSETAVIILTAFDDLTYAEQAKNLGAYGYILKPLNRIEVLFSIRNALHFRERLLPDKNLQNTKLQEPDVHNPSPRAVSSDSTGNHWVINQQKWTLIAPNSVEIPLTNLELKLLKALAEKGEEAVDRSFLMEHLYPRLDDYTSKALNASVKRLRLKISQTCGLPAPIQTVHGFGYSFSEPIFFFN